MKTMKFFFLCMLMILPVTMLAQDDEDDYNEEEDSYEQVTYARKKGFMFGLNIGLLIPNNEPAQFYNGTAPNDITPYLTNTNSNSYQEITEFIGGYDFVRDQTFLPIMNYSNGVNFGFNTRYQFDWHNAVVADLNYSQLTATGVMRLISAEEPGDGSTQDIIKFLDMYGKEQRLMISLGYQATLSEPSAMGFIFEVGPMITSVKVVRNAFVVGDREFNILRSRTLVGNQFANDRQQTVNDFGAYTAIGTNIEFDKFTVDAMFRASYERIQFDKEIEAKYKLNFLPQLRFTYRIIK